ncbi:hypothetical protein SAMN04488238_102135 [Roseicitreum antarcticum]|uniref:Uncharacterized protein n=1 Tax=Roseicitreum antarcticum TaxID=564137 RepID=A0A1H2TS13_9RHOB|nr:hypothetical protein SAMN04488238_102135 [Roseicitreum antarcticum]
MPVLGTGLVPGIRGMGMVLPFKTPWGVGPAEGRLNVKDMSDGTPFAATNLGFMWVFLASGKNRPIDY